MVAANEDYFHYVDKYIFGSMEDLSLKIKIHNNNEGWESWRCEDYIQWCDISVLVCWDDNSQVHIDKLFIIPGEN